MFFSLGYKCYNKGQKLYSYIGRQKKNEIYFDQTESRYVLENFSICSADVHTKFLCIHISTTASYLEFTPSQPRQRGMV